MKTTSWGKRASNRAASDILLAGAIAATGMAALAVACGGTTTLTGSPPVAVIAAHAPVDFAFDSLDVRPVSAEATRGKPTVLTFVTISSLPSQAQVDFLVAMAKNDGDRVNYAVVALDQRDDRELVELYRKALAIPFAVAMADAETRSGRGVFGDLSAVPVTVVLDRLGRVVSRVDGRVAKSEELRATMRGL